LGVHAKLIYKYQIVYLDRITIVVWHHLVNDIDLCCCLKSPKKSIKPPILAFKVIEFDANQEPVYHFLLVINSSLGPIWHRYWHTATKRLIGPKSKILPTPLSFSTLVWGDSFRIYGEALQFLKLGSSRQLMVKIWWS